MKRRTRRRSPAALQAETQTFHRDHERALDWIRERALLCVGDALTGRSGSAFALPANVSASRRRRLTCELLREELDEQRGELRGLRRRATHRHRGDRPWRRRRPAGSGRCRAGRTGGRSAAGCPAPHELTGALWRVGFPRGRLLGRRGLVESAAERGRRIEVVVVITGPTGHGPPDRGNAFECGRPRGQPFS